MRRAWRTISPASFPCRTIYPQPLALRYHGHQFQVYNPEIGDGRGFLFAQPATREDRRLLDLAHQGQRPDALVARRRRAAHAEGRRARGAGDARCWRRSASTPRSRSACSRPASGWSAAMSPRRRARACWCGFRPFPRALRHLPAPRRHGDAMRITAPVRYSVRHYLPQAARPTTGDEAAAFLR